MKGSKVDVYLRNVFYYLQNTWATKVVSVVLFGSVVGKEEKNRSVSDIDLIIVIGDDCSTEEKNAITSGLDFIVQKHFGSTINSNNPFLCGLEKATGMFINNFVCYYSQFIARDFPGVFGINSLVSRFLAPSSSVWISILNQHEILYGEDLFKEWQFHLVLKKIDLIKSFIMNTLLSLGAIFLCPVLKSSVKFSMEAMKWSLFTWRNYHDLNITSPNDIMMEYIRKNSYNDRLIARSALLFVRYRTTGVIGRKLSVLALIFVLKLHILLISEYKRK
ncbi:MAG: hypothetical protein ACTSW1_18970 [Candidatus Hodarchaeales archaeon]